MPLRWSRSASIIGTCMLFIGMGVGMQVASSDAGEPVNPLLREFSIHIDPSRLNPPTKWQVPGITPLIWIHDPVSTVAYSTTDAKALKLKPGKYQFGTFTFSFFFHVTLSGTLKYDESLDQCVKGRDSQTLTIHCSHTQPYPQEPEY